MKNIILILSMIIGLAACSERTLTINDAANAGFKKGSQKAFKMIGAQDGWAGSWEGEAVELYQFDPISDAISGFHEMTIQLLGSTSWVESCKVSNMVMTSKGKKACKALNGLR